MAKRHLPRQNQPIPRQALQTVLANLNQIEALNASAEASRGRPAPLCYMRQRLEPLCLARSSECTCSMQGDDA